MNFALSGDFVVELADSCAGLDPGGLGRHVDFDGAEVLHVEEEERGFGDVRDALVVVSAAADLHAKVVLLGGEYGGADVGDMRRGDDEEGFRGLRGVEPEVSDVGLEDGEECQGIRGVDCGRSDWVRRVGVVQK